MAGGDGYPGSRLGSRADAQGDGMGPQRAKSKAEKRKSSQRSSEVLKELLKELDKAAHDVAGGDGYPGSRLGSRADAQGDGMGPQRAKSKAEKRKSSQRSSEVLKELLKELDKAAHVSPPEDTMLPMRSGYFYLVQLACFLLKVRDWGPVEKEALQEGGSRAAPVSDESTRAIQSAGVPVLSNPGEAHHAGMDDFLPKNAGVDGKRNTNVADPKDFQKYCIEGAMAILGSMLFGMGLCCAICLWRVRKKRLSAASQAQPNPSSYH
ncbi:uncharacterized protein LOC141733351 [Larus michahellis]|uniref:uncharacterized protein LOC141733351 n=1 Tax=Larus michahellis TaxID=119627 RepID=UPI003D9B1ED8